MNKIGTSSTIGTDIDHVVSDLKKERAQQHFIYELFIIYKIIKIRLLILIQIIT
jgi:hypothetical protein